MTDTYDPAKDSFESYNAAIAALRAKLLRERCPAAKRVEVIGGCELYLGDCTDVIPALEKVDDVLCDPPYGIGAGKMSFGKWRTSRMLKSEWDASAPDEDVFGAILECSSRQIIWGGNYFGLPAARGFLIWDKGAGFRGRDFAECEFAWTSIDMNARLLTRDPLARGDYRDKQHPTQKPVAVMDWCLSFLPGAGVVFDPFMGSGTTGVSCAKAGRRFVGVEIDEAYFDIACERIRKAYAQPDLFVGSPSPKKEEKQEALL